MKYNKEYCKNNKVAIKVIHIFEYEKIDKIINSKNTENCDFFYKQNKIGYAVLQDDGCNFDLRIWSDKWILLKEYEIITFEQFIEDNMEVNYQMVIG